MTKIRILFLILTIATVGTLGYFTSLYARGYRINFKELKFTPSGILVIKSDPDSAQVFIDGNFTNATNTTINLAPGAYDIEIKKDGYLNWNKRIIIDKEVVTEIDANLFRNVPSLTPATFLGAKNPVLSSDSTKIIFAQLATDADSETNKAGLWLIETIPFPFGFPKDPRQITDGNLTDTLWQFSPDGRQILLTTKNASYLVDSGTYTPQSQMVNIAQKKADTILAWEKEKKQKTLARIKNLPPDLQDIMVRKGSNIVFSPDDSKILYIASGSATIKDNLIPSLPGSSTQKQARSIEVSHTYIYDIKEDRNFLIDEGNPQPEIENDSSILKSSKRLFWFPNSKNLVLAEDGKIIIMDYDGTNRQNVYSGSYITPFVFTFGSNQKLLILTNLGAGSSTSNLYYLSLK